MNHLFSSEMSITAECGGSGGKYNIYANGALIGQYDIGSAQQKLNYTVIYT